MPRVFPHRTGSYTKLQTADVVNALCRFTKGIIVTKALQQKPQNQKHKKWHLLYFSADHLQKGLVQPLVEQQSNAAVLLLKLGHTPTGAIMSQTHTILPTYVSVFDF